MKYLIAAAAVAVIGVAGLYAYETNRTWKKEAEAEAIAECKKAIWAQEQWKKEGNQQLADVFNDTVAECRTKY